MRWATLRFYYRNVSLYHYLKMNSVNTSPENLTMLTGNDKLTNCIIIKFDKYLILSTRFAVLTAKTYRAAEFNDKNKIGGQHHSGRTAMVNYLVSSYR